MQRDSMRLLLLTDDKGKPLDSTIIRERVFINNLRISCFTDEEIMLTGYINLYETIGENISHVDNVSGKTSILTHMYFSSVVPYDELSRFAKKHRDPIFPGGPFEGDFKLISTEKGHVYGDYYAETLALPKT